MPHWGAGVSPWLRHGRERRYSRHLGRGRARLTRFGGRDARAPSEELAWYA